MPSKLILGLFVLLIIVVFAAQNACSITINFMFWNFSISLSVILVICILCGALVGSLFTAVSISRKNKKVQMQEQLKAEAGTATPEQKSNDINHK